MSSIVENSGRPNAISIHYSTTTFKAKSLAQKLHRLCCSRGISTTIDRFDDTCTAFCPSTHQLENASTLHIFIVSTTGAGQINGDLNPLWSKLLKKSHPLLSSMLFTVFSLGSTNYGTDFCAAGRKLASRLTQLGGNAFVDHGFGDDVAPGGGVYGGFDFWWSNVLEPNLRESFAITGEIDDSPSLGDEIYQVSVIEDSMNDDTFVSKFLSETVAPKGAVGGSLRADVLMNRRMTANDWYQNVREMSLRVRSGNTEKCVKADPLSQEKENVLGNSDNIPVPYEAGDVLVVMPENSPEKVENLLKVLPRQVSDLVDKTLSIVPKAIDRTGRAETVLWPTKTTLRSILTRCADVSALPSREFLRAISVFVDLEAPNGEDHRKKLIELSESSGNALYSDFVLREKRTIPDVLYDFDTIQTNKDFTISRLLELLEPMRPREFSLASSPTVDGEIDSSEDFTVHLCVAVVDERTKRGRKYEGLASGFLDRLEEGDAIKNCWLTKGSFRRITKSEKAILCIGSGTGIAPLRGILRERGGEGSQKKKDIVDKLVFGCRKKSKDLHFGVEWENMVAENALSFHPAFSQDQIAKIYVQNVLAKLGDGLFVAEHVAAGGGIAIAGGSKMAKDVRETIVEVLGQLCFGGDKNQSDIFVKKMERSGLYACEAWD